MIIDKSRQLFIGCKVSGRLREALDTATPDIKAYFEQPNSPYLRLCKLEEEVWIGKVIEPGFHVGQAEDLQNNVLSILRRIAPGVRHTANDLKIFALDTSAGAGESLAAGEAEEEEPDPDAW
jgi:hypothetical protein